MPLADDILYLLLDGVYLRMKGVSGASRRLVLCAYGVSVRGERRLLDFRLAPSESAAHWEAFLSQLRGPYPNLHTIRVATSVHQSIGLLPSNCVRGRESSVPCLPYMGRDAL